jgi:hypothetical protein
MFALEGQKNFNFNVFRLNYSQSFYNKTADMRAMLLLPTLVAAATRHRGAYDATLEIGASSEACPVYGTCSSGGVTGVCVSVSAGCCSGNVDSGDLCPGSDDILCCTSNACSTPGGSGSCMQTAKCYQSGGVPDSGNYCLGPDDVQCCVEGGGGGGGGGGVSRVEMIDRAQHWVDARVPYSQSDYFEGYRADCSGYVSMAWKLPSSYVTWTLEEVCTRISRSQLQAGDIILAPSHHVLIFHKWIDSDRFYEYAQHDFGQVASHDATSYSYYESQGYFPCRFNSVAGVRSDSTAPIAA